MKKIIISVLVCVALVVAACLSWMFEKSDIQCLLLIIAAFFPYCYFEEGLNEYKEKKNA